MIKCVNFQLYKVHPDGVIYKPGNWRQTYKQTSSTFFTSNDVPRRKNFSTSLQGCEIALNIPLKKIYISSHWRCGSSHQRCSVRKGVLTNFANSTGKYLRWRLQHKCFAVKFAKLYEYIFWGISANDCFWRCSIKKFDLRNFAMFTRQK